ncbi:MAG: aromatic amino acid lyase, partial [Planctomycetota bacterium]|nr:aromatic amino acid lyase [Planctomycetota bacterium]
MTIDSIQLDGSPLPLETVEAVARHGASVQIADSAILRIEQARAHVDRLASSDQPYYGLNTGFGSLSQVRIEPDNVREVQKNIIRSHAAGVGDPLPVEVVRGMLLILAASLCRGHSGVRTELVHRIVDLLNKGVTPIVPSRGSVGASGDLAPLAHAALVLLGEGDAMYQDESMSGGKALKKAGLEPINPVAKEGLALLNGTHLMTSIGTLALCDIARLQDAALTGAAMAVDACRASDGPFDARLHKARNQVGQQDVARLMRERLAGSQIVNDHKENDPRVQDPYSLRAI